MNQGVLMTKGLQLLLFFVSLSCGATQVWGGCGASSLGIYEPLEDDVYSEVISQGEYLIDSDGKVDFFGKELTAEQLSPILCCLGSLEDNNANRIKKIRLSKNNLTELPAEIRQLKNLEELMLSFNQLAELPDVFDKLKKLEVIYLRENELSKNALRNICKSPNLKWLDLSFNKLMELPEEIGELQKLEIIDITGNHLDKEKVQELVGNSVEIRNAPGEDTPRK